MRRLERAESKRRVAVLFDLEDTLVQTPWSDHQHVLEFRRRTREKLLALGIPSEVLEGLERSTLLRNKASEYVERHFTQEAASRFRREMERFLCRYEMDSAKKSRLFPETVLALEILKESGVKMGLVTNTSRKAVDVAFRVHCLKSYFDVVVTRESVARLKPDPEGILLAVKELGASRFFMVGDLMFDILAAKRANGLAIVVMREPETSDFQSLSKSLPGEPLENAQRSEQRGDLRPDFVVKSLTEVLRILRDEEAKIGCCH
jgi:HAD superfamily hydrolase (TIGR01549 family)